MRAEVELSLAAAEARSAELESSLQAITLEHQALERERVELQDQLDDKAASEDEMTTRLLDAQDRLTELEQDSKARTAWLSAELASSRTQVGSLRDKLAQLEEAQRERDRTIARLRVENKALWGRIDGGK